MRYLILAASVATAFSVTGTVAQTAAPSPTVQTAPPATPLGLGPSKKLDVTNLVAPNELEAGNSTLTEPQARARIQATGFSNISNLAKDEKGIWRANAKLGNRTANVGLDRKGNVAAAIE